MVQRNGLLLLTVLLCALLFTGAAVATLDLYNINWKVFGGGGGPIQSASYRLNSTIGQGLTSSSQSASYRLQSGYWAGMVSAAAVPTPTRTMTPVPGLPPRAWLPIMMRNFYEP